MDICYLNMYIVFKELLLQIYNIFMFSIILPELTLIEILTKIDLCVIFNIYHPFYSIK